MDFPSPCLGFSDARTRKIGKQCADPSSPIFQLGCDSCPSCKFAATDTLPSFSGKQTARMSLIKVARSAVVQSLLKRSTIAVAGAAGLSALAIWSETSTPCQLEAAPSYLTANFIADAAAKASPALVNIRCESAFTQSSGSGFVVDSSGIILTNSHVVSGALHSSRMGSAAIRVTLSDGMTELRGVVEHADEASDIAIVRVQPNNPLPSVQLGTSANLRPGEFVIALGAPAGLSNSVSAGIVSAVQRTRSEIGLRQNRGSRAGSTMEYIQTDAAINSGNSGGPLLNLAGEVIGVNTMKAMGMDGIAFALPIDDVKRVVDHLMRHGRVLRPYLGLKFVELDANIANELRHRASATQGGGGAPGSFSLTPWRSGKSSSSSPPDHGLYVMHVTPDSPAQHGGVRVGDTITALDRNVIGTTKELVDGLADKVGRQVRLELQRGSQKVEVSCHIESMQQ